MLEVALKVENHGGLDETKICYWKNNTLECWFIYIPGCGAGRLTNHTVVEHDDGTITVTPSILVYAHKGASPSQRHGYLTHGVWNEC